MAHKKGAGSTRNGRDSNSQRRGVKVYGGETVRAGNIIVRQVGETISAGKGVPSRRPPTTTMKSNFRGSTRSDDG